MNKLEQRLTELCLEDKFFFIFKNKIYDILISALKKRGDHNNTISRKNAKLCLKYYGIPKKLVFFFIEQMQKDGILIRRGQQYFEVDGQASEHHK